ncbi:MAG: hypothetical protein A2431_03885 [Candidatus Zambryskibacteria bacterium RIFOXYC1_FULL_39_10]|uniref:Uncharacterized protein n=1 Tax=Candidatus Zambryskibacteria bacterium RIFOXYC1_FULL_39_10 TaxID=1802779 RepID=A0A1G2V188_9BACT|nr:MAG: hypothetical protein A2431_03885 [Candidatus Zambryskibacteria bacterium RIFOXYC1_FULL_39_10]OHB16485.1 MAG: hypothetical protein A2605_01590 [Candidatus Zambryskibacteria bacterium RIFOXYD1_FULL_39_35]
MLNKIYKAVPFLILLILPIFTYAQLTETRNFLTAARDIVSNILIPLAFTLALLFFFYGVAKYIWAEGQGKDDGKKIMIWGVVALFVMSSIWGIIYFVRTEIGIENDSAIPIPTIGGSGSGGSGNGCAATGEC